jgi:2-polyprenyl-6-methoxyphenol hydroxylase-like FAD-dependent oxidoreductase
VRVVPEVIVVGAGPVGLLLASRLRAHGVDVLLLERREVGGDRSRAIGIHAPVLAALEPGGVTERLLAEAVRVSRGEARDGAGSVLGTVRFDRLSTRFPFVATLPQPLTERALAGADADAGGGTLLRGVTVREVQGGRDGVRVRAVDAGGEREWRASAVVVATGAGGRELVYRPGAVPVHQYADRYVMADLAVPAASTDVAVVTLAPGGVLESFPLPHGSRRFVAWDGRGDDPAPTEAAARLRRALRERGHGEIDVDEAAVTTFRVRRAVAPALRRGRVLVVGDTAHEVSPIGGQGMNLGLLDAAGLAPLLAQWVRSGQAPDAALERWERRRVQSARWAAALAAVNTGLGRPRSAVGDGIRAAALRTALRGPSGYLFAHAYAMGFDRGA